MIGGLTGRPVEYSTGAGHADADRDELATVAADALDEGEPGVDHPAEHGFRPVRDVDRLAVFGEHGAREVGDCDRRVRGAEVGGEHDAGRRD